MNSAQQSKHGFFSNPFIVCGLVAAALFLSVSAVRIVIRASAIHGEEKKLEQDRAALEEKKRNLELALEHANSPEVIERIAKEKLNLKNEGEQVVVVKTEIATSTPEVGFLQGIIPDWLKRLFGF